MQIIKTISSPDEHLLSEVAPLPDGLRAIVWNLRDRPQNANYVDTYAVILPYVDAYKVFKSLSVVPELKLVQTPTRFTREGFLPATARPAGALTSGIPLAQVRFADFPAGTPRQVFHYHQAQVAY